MAWLGPRSSFSVLGRSSFSSLNTHHVPNGPFLLAGDSNVHRIADAIPDDTALDCLPVSGARFIKDTKSFCSLLQRKLESTAYGQVYLHLGSNDVLAAEETFFRNVADLCDAIHATSPSTSIVLCEVLPRVPDNRRWIRSRNQDTRLHNRWINRANRLLEDMCDNIPYIRYLRYHGFFRDKYLTKDGLHLNQEGAEMCYDTLAADFERQGGVEDKVKEDLCYVESEWPCLPSNDSQKPEEAPERKQLYSAVVQEGPEKQKPKMANKVIKVIVRKPARKRASRRSYRKLRKMQGKKKFPRTTPVSMDIPTDGIWVPARDGVDVLIKYGNIHGKLLKARYQAVDEEDQPQIPEETLSYPTQKKKREVEWLYCPDCSVRCSHEDFLLDHLIRKHSTNDDQIQQRDDKSKAVKTDQEDGIEDCQQFVTKETPTQMKEIMYCEGEYLIFPPSMWRSFHNMMIIALLCGRKGLHHVLQRLLIQQHVNTTQQRLLLSGDVEQNPGPTYHCKWDMCQHKLDTFIALKLHIAEHVQKTRQCRWMNCSGCSALEFEEQYHHSVRHVYQVKEYFPTIEDWYAVLQSGKLTDTINLHCCPQHLRSKLQLLLFDEDFEIKCDPYTVQMHKSFLNRLSIQDKEFDNIKDQFLKKRADLGEDWSSCIQMITAASSSTSDISSNVPLDARKDIQFDFVQTKRPELCANSFSATHLLPLENKKKRKRTEPSCSFSQWFINLTNNLSSCEEAINFQKSILNHMFKTSLVTSKQQSFVKLEQEAARLASVNNCTNGSFVCTLFRYNFCGKDILYIRYVESGVYRGFMLQKYISEIKEKYNATNENIFLHNVITTEDINELSKEQGKDNQKRSRPDKIYNRCIASIVPFEVENLKTVQQSSDLQLESFIVHFLPMKTKASVDSKENMYLQMSDGEVNDMKKTLIDFRLNKLESPIVQTKDLFKEQSRHPTTLFEQSIVLNSLSGDHKLKANLFNRCTRFESNFMINSYTITSLRFKTLYLYLQRNLDELFAFYKIYFPELNESISFNAESKTSCNDPAKPPHKKRKFNKSLNKFTITKDRVEHQISPSDNITEEEYTVNIYDNFCCSILDNGKLSIQHFNKQDGSIVCCMNDCSSTFRQNDFVHTIREKQETGDYFLCSCSVYRTLINLNENENTIDKDYIVLDPDSAAFVTCIHCRFLKDKILPALESENVCKSSINQLILNAKNDMGKRIVKMSENNETHKYSIFTGDDDRPSFVHFTFNKRINNYLISCLNGKCVALRGHKRSINTLLSSSVCKHLTIFKENTQYWQHLVDKTDAAVNSGSSNVNELYFQSLHTNSNDNNNSISEKQVNFDEESGLWKFKCRSIHSPLSKDDSKYRENVLKRDTWNDFNFKRVSDGCLKGNILVSDIPDSPCSCGAGWTKENENNQTNGRTAHDKGRTITVYTMVAPVKFDVHFRLCCNLDNPCILYWDEGKNDAIHVLSRDTAAGDEIGWEFVSMVMNSGCTFSSYCQIKNEAYKLRDCKAKFMDPTTFINWWFSWAASMKIDFRQPCDVCGFEPKRLCCDGTKVGVGFRHALFDEISKTNTDDDVHQTLHRRMDRCFLKNLNRKNKQEIIRHRETLNYLAKSVIGELNNNEILIEDDLNVRINSLKSVLPDDVCLSFERFFLMDDPEKIAYAYVLKMLSTTASVTSFLPPTFCHKLQQLVNDPLTDSFNTIVSEMRTYAPELRDLICESLICNDENLPNDIRIFLQYLINESLSLECNIPDDPVPQPGTYNPSKFGRAYYFNKTGSKLRNIRKYTIDLEKTTKNNIDHDDIPLDFERCQKLYSKVQTSAPGTSTLFLWFCADHGHCYGFHMTGAEGRKDPSASLYSYLEKPPTDIFYDFACNLQEYCLNRESGYFKNIRFFHDIFHSYAHKCSSAFKSIRLQGFESVNSEICEQFNSFIQCIKKSARQMSQEHFCFYLQFFLNEWNKKKRALARKKIQIALASLD